MQYKSYLAITTYLANETIDITERWVQVVANIKNLTVEEVGLLSKRDFNELVIQVEKELTNITLSKEPIKEFIYDDKKYTVDTSIFDGNVNLFRDYEALCKRYKDKNFMLFKHIVALLFYTKGDEVYTTSRYNKNLDIVDELPVEIVFSISNFFLSLLQSWKQFSQTFSEAQTYLPKMEQIITLMELAKPSTKNIQ